MVPLQAIGMLVTKIYQPGTGKCPYTMSAFRDNVTHREVGLIIELKYYDYQYGLGYAAVTNFKTSML